MNLKYRADIDGLRAIAVIAVIFFHADIPGFSGGFVGVDIFFVISGFLITSIILKEIHDGTFSIAKFYERRIRRIFPALFPVIAFTLIVGIFIFDYKTFKQLGQSITSTTLFASNILFWMQSGYFDSPSLQKPLLHTWSLAVEEQFYIFFPLFLAGINKFLDKRYLPWTLLIGFLSLITSIYGVYNQPSPTFYLVPTRAWELLVGSIIALRVISPPQSNIFRSLLAIFGVALIFYSIIFYTKFIIFPGHNAIFPVLGTACIIHSGIGGQSSIGKLLGLKPLVFIGLISYSLYLWHWPLIVFAKYLLFRELSTLEVSVIIFITFIISVLSLQYIEKPFRGHQPIIPERNKLFALSALIMLIASVIGLVIHLQNGMPYRSEANATIMKYDNEQEWKKNVEIEENAANAITAGKAPPIIGAKNTTPSFILWGDSHARVLSTVVYEKAKQYRLSGFLATNSGAPPILSLDQKKPHFNGSQFNEGVISFIKSHPEVKTVILSSMWAAYANRDNMQDDPLTWKPKQSDNESNSVLLRKGIIKTVNILLGLGRKIIIINDVPLIGGDALRLYCVHSLTGESYNDLLPTISKYKKNNQTVYDLFQELTKRPDVTLISPESMLFDINKRARLTNNNILLYRDDNHLSHYGTLFVAPLFDEAFKKMVLLH